MTEQELLKKLIPIRRRIHQYPELGNQEYETAGFVEKILKELKIPSRRVGKTGVLGTLKSGSPGTQCIALRADMDALPLTEKNNKSYRSKNPGVMHACGHDAHVTMLLGAALLLTKTKDFRGTIKFFFQPNEEGAGGAKSLIAGGVMKNPKVDAVFGLHVNPRLPTRTIGLKAGPLMAAVDKFAIEVLGEGGHAAYPHEGIDAIAIAAEIIQSLQTIVSRKTDPLDPLVVTVGTVQAGSRYNILAGQALLTGTVRTLSEKVHRAVPQLMRQVVTGVARAHGAQVRLQYEGIGSLLSNSKPMKELAQEVAVRLFGKERVLSLEKASMGGEDFAEYLKFAPGCFGYVGTGTGKKLIPWHHPEFDIDETVLPVGAQFLAGITTQFLQG